MVKHLFVIIAMILLVQIVSAESDYCTPLPNDITTTIDHNGDWFNITFTSPSCYTCVDNGAGYGDVECTPCLETVDFTSNVTCGIVPFSAQFNDTSSGIVTDYYWDFANGNTSADQNPIANYTIPGVYGVDHSATVNGNLLWKNETGYITARAIGDTCASPSSGYVSGGGGLTQSSDSMWLIYGGIGAFILLFVIIFLWAVRQ